MRETIHNSSSQSMKNLTDKVLKADLASKKKKMISIKSAKIAQLLFLPFAYYAVKVNFFHFYLN